jgi:hypothetical protein
MSQHNPFSELYGQFLRPHGLVFVWHALSTVGSYIERCVPHVQFTTGKPTSNQGCSMETGCTWAQFWVS